ncbi:DUF2336 domain-containing protein [Pyruvatibacter sp. HU-CL02332]|uniref:DUF2336 domain-containing protein n=1 Tax=Pyruvatibacter sp. HU-CL02332 TaxID=3127650 RepID=UPI00296A7D64|nr:DUF2336 domain-containing protein [Alphaproteobacteria bacterium]
MNSTASRLADLAELLRDPTPEGRSALLACVTDLYVSGADDCSDDARDGFGLLLVDIARMAGADAQQVLARSIAHDEAPPATLVAFLLDQPAWVAAPFIAATPTLDDTALSELIETHGDVHAAGIAQRQGLSSVLVRKILTTGNDAAFVCLAENHDAPLQRADFETLKAAAPALPHLQAALARRNDLPADVAVTLMWDTGARHGRQALEQALAVTTDALSLAIEAAGAIGMSEGKAIPHAEEAASYAVQKYSRHELKEPLVVRLLRDGDMDRFYACLDKLTNIDRATGEAIMAEKSGFALMVACRAARFARSTFSTLVRLGEDGAQRSTDQTFELMSAFETLDDASAERLLGFWQVLFAGAELADVDDARDARQAS